MDEAMLKTLVYIGVGLLVIMIVFLPDRTVGRQVLYQVDELNVYSDGCDFCDSGNRILCVRATDHGTYHTARFCPICGKSLPSIPDDNAQENENA